jgi:stage II sporulation protein AB (anti-sigma F factor)
MSQAEKMMTFAISNEPARVHEARHLVRDFLMDVEASEDDVFEVLVAVEEAAANALRHGGRPPGEGLIEIRCIYSPAEIVVQVVDDGPGFEYDPAAVVEMPDPMASGGRGLFLMYKLMDRIVVESSAHGTVVTMSRALRGREDVPADETRDRTYRREDDIWGREVSE